MKKLAGGNNFIALPRFDSAGTGYGLAPNERKATGCEESQKSKRSGVHRQKRFEGGVKPWSSKRLEQSMILFLHLTRFPNVLGYGK